MCVCVHARIVHRAYKQVCVFTLNMLVCSHVMERECVCVHACVCVCACDSICMYGSLLVCMQVCMRVKLSGYLLFASLCVSRMCIHAYQSEMCMYACVCDSPFKWYIENCSSIPQFFTTVFVNWHIICDPPNRDPVLFVTILNHFNFVHYQYLYLFISISEWCIFHDGQGSKTMLQLH